MRKIIFYPLYRSVISKLSQVFNPCNIAYILTDKPIKYEKFNNYPIYTIDRFTNETQMTPNDVIIVILNENPREAQELFTQYGFGKSCVSLQHIKDYMRNGGDVHDLDFLAASANDERLVSDMRDGMLRVRITNKCNAKCRWCNQHGWSEETNSLSLDKDVLFKYYKPLYERIKVILMTGGEPLLPKHSYEYAKFISESYPGITLYLETNGILFNAKLRELAADNLFMVHMSVNGSDEDNYSKSCWAGEPGKSAFRRVQSNIGAYMELLKERKLEAFAPSLSMVINRDNALYIRDFVKLALGYGASKCGFFFDCSEINQCMPYFPCPEIYRPVLREMLEIEKVLSGKFAVLYRLWVPYLEIEMMKPDIDAQSMASLCNKYEDLVELSKARSIHNEYEARREAREKKHKKILTYDEDYNLTIRTRDVNGTKVCAAPYEMLDVYPDLSLHCCGWLTPVLNLMSFYREDEDRIDYDEMYNSLPMKRIRYEMLNNDYTHCPPYCPLNPMFHSVNPYIWGEEK